MEKEMPRNVSPHAGLTPTAASHQSAGVQESPLLSLVFLRRGHRWAGPLEFRRQPEVQKRHPCFPDLDSDPELSTWAAHRRPAGR